MKKVEDVPFGLKAMDLELISKTFSQFTEIEKVVLFGSRAMGNYKPYSDIDIALFGASIDLTRQNKIENQLDDLLLPYKFDVCVFEKIENKELIDHIDRVGITIFSRG